MKNFVILASLALNVLLGCLCYFLWPPRIGELANYGENSHIQGVFAKASWDSIKDLSVVEDDGSLFALFREPEPVVLLLNPNVIPTIKIYPSDRKISVSQSELNEILQLGGVAEDVKTFLQNLAE